MKLGDKIYTLKAGYIQFPISCERRGNCRWRLYCFQSICSVVISTHFEVHENALPELVEAEEVERADAVSTAVRWVNETITEELRGIEPSNQAGVDQVLR